MMPTTQYNYTPRVDNAATRFLDRLIKDMNLRNDAALARRLEVNAPLISKIRHGKFGVSAELIIRIHEKTDIPVKEIKAALAGGQS
jgi:transcriptional regulator with XRE-family HTH domain